VIAAEWHDNLSFFLLTKDKPCEPAPVPSFFLPITVNLIPADSVTIPNVKPETHHENCVPMPAYALLHGLSTWNDIFSGPEDLENDGLVFEGSL